ncbi:MAG TPA: PQQ-binding-like beta-propeller repeat protein [Mycobacterium sp.]|nr:PQQ-binding-like beta-propeller repeat protein [Mycobacterium sp.]
MTKQTSRLMRITTGLALAITVAGVGAAAPAAAAPSAQWPMFGQNVNNTAANVSAINASNVGRLAPKWVFTTGGDISARAAVVNGVAYFPDWSGHVYAVNAGTGALIWAKSIVNDYLPGVFDPAPAKVVSRTSPAVDISTNTVYLGTQTGAYLLAIDTATGALKWRTQLDDHPLAIDTQSPVVYNGVVYVGVASLEEAAAVDPNYPCCSFRGSTLAVNAASGQILWKTYLAPPGYNGVAVWGSTVVPDPQRGYVYVTTGNNYYTPTDPAYQSCIANGGTQEQCNSPDDHVDSILALRMSTGQIVWASRFASADDWNVACFINFTNCPVNAGPDFDFGSGVNLITVQTKKGPVQILGAGQKSGVYSALDPSTGKVLWATQVGPGSSLGGIEWGSASDGNRIYVAIGNLYGIPYTVGGQTDVAGSWAALDPITGRIIWQVADPNAAIDLGPVAVSNGVVYAGSMARGTTQQTMFALRASSGQTLWTYPAGGSVIAGATIVDGTVYWGSGYSNLGPDLGTANNKFYAFSPTG